MVLIHISSNLTNFEKVYIYNYYLISLLTNMSKILVNIYGIEETVKLKIYPMGGNICQIVWTGSRH